MAPKFEKRHFEYLGHILIQINKKDFDKLPNAKQDVISTFIEYLSHTNKNFDAKKFREYVYEQWT